MTEGDIDDEYDFAANLTAGSPTPTLSLNASAANIPATMSFQGTILKITPTSDFVKTMQFSFGVVATNGIAGDDSNMFITKSVTLNIVPVFTDGEDIVFSSNDFDEIRKLVDTQLSVQELPDEIIDNDSIIGGAIAWGITTMPIQQFERTLEELKAKRRAIIYRAAGLLAASTRRSTSPTFEALGIETPELEQDLFMEADLQRQIANRDLTDPEDSALDPFFIIVKRDY